LKKRYEIKIFGRELAVLSDAEDEQVANVVRYVNEEWKILCNQAMGSGPWMWLSWQL